MSKDQKPLAEHCSLCGGTQKAGKMLDVAVTATDGEYRWAHEGCLDEVPPQ